LIVALNDGQINEFLGLRRRLWAG